MGNITTTGPTIGPAKEGDRMYGSMIRTDESTWAIVTQFNGQTSTLNAQVGPWTYDWAVATMEEYSVNSCDQYPHQPVTFDTIELYDPAGSIVHPSWTNPGATMCSGRTTIQDEKNCVNPAWVFVFNRINFSVGAIMDLWCIKLAAVAFSHTFFTFCFHSGDRQFPRNCDLQSSVGVHLHVA